MVGSRALKSLYNVANLVADNDGFTCLIAGCEIQADIPDMLDVMARKIVLILPYRLNHIGHGHRPAISGFHRLPIMHKLSM